MDATKCYNTVAADAQERWFVIDAEGQILGRLATVVAEILRGKHNPKYAPHIDVGDHVIIINASKIEVTGKRLDQKVYYRHSGYMGGLKETTMRKLMDERPEEVVRRAVKGMMPKTKMGRSQLKKLRIYVDAEHKHHGQQPKPFTIDTKAKKGAAS